MVEFSLSGAGWPEILVARPTPKNDEPWGELASLKGTAFESLITVIPHEILNHAVYGHLTPFMRVIGIDPAYRLKKIPEPYRRCNYAKNCLSFDKNNCHPCLKTPQCYTSPNMSEEASLAAAQVIKAWKEKRYVIIIEE